MNKTQCCEKCRPYVSEGIREILCLGQGVCTCHAPTNKGMLVEELISELSPKARIEYETELMKLQNKETTPEWKEEFSKEHFMRIMNDNAPITDMITYIDSLLATATTEAREEVMHEMRKAILSKVQKFIDKVDSGLACSKEMYADMKEIRKLLEPAIVLKEAARHSNEE